MRKVILAALLFSSPAWGAGDESELRCDSPGAGVTCHCSEPLTANNGSHYNQTFNPIGTSGSTQCFNGGNALQYTGVSETVESVRATSLTNPISVGGSGYVLHMTPNTRAKLYDVERVFTGGTYCQRHYAYYASNYDCSGSGICNIKGPYMDGAERGIHLGFQHFMNYNAWHPKPGAYGTPQMGKCALDSPITGCASVSGLRSQHVSGSLDFNRMQGAWVRWEICVDHNLSAAQVAAANSEYNTAITHPEANRVYIREKHVMVTGPNAGSEKLWGPGYAENPVATISTGSRVWIGGSAAGTPGADALTIGDYYTSYNMVVTKSTADPLYWIGPAIEVEGGLASSGDDGPADTQTAPIGKPGTPYVIDP